MLTLTLFSKVLTVAALLPPFLCPRPAKPVLNLQRLYPQTVEQRSSYAEILFFTFLDPLIFKAWKVTALPYDDLPPLADTDTAEHLRNRMMHILDPLSSSPRAIKGRRHLGWRILQAWWKEATACLFLSVAYAIVEFFSVIGVNRLLSYLETDGKDAIVRPEVYILMIGVGPYLGGLIFNLHIYISTRFMAQAEGILTSVIFEHSLRIQLRDDGADKMKGARSTAPSEAGDDQSTPESKPDQDGDDEGEAKGNLVGRINNLVR